MLELTVSDYQQISGQKCYVTMHVYIPIEYIKLSGKSARSEACEQSYSQLIGSGDKHYDMKITYKTVKPTNVRSRLLS